MLASASPRRLELLAQVGLVPTQVLPSDIDESPKAKETPRRLALRLAAEKAAACPATDAFILAADTIVALGRRMLPKTDDEAEARAALGKLSGRPHRVVTAVAVRSPAGRTAARLCESRVTFKRLTDGEVSAYLERGEWRGKAGAYAIQGRAGAFVTDLTGSYSGVVGLPLYETLSLLNGLGYPLP